MQGYARVVKRCLGVLTTTQWTKSSHLFVYRSGLSNVEPCNKWCIPEDRETRCQNWDLKNILTEDPETSVTFCRGKSVSNTKWIAAVSKWRSIPIYFERTLRVKLHAMNIWSRVSCKRQLLIAAHKVACMSLMRKNTSNVNSSLLEERRRRISKFPFLWMALTFQMHRCDDGQMRHSSKRLYYNRRWFSDGLKTFSVLWLVLPIELTVI